jgi:hypothetical protein
MFEAISATTPIGNKNKDNQKGRITKLLQVINYSSTGGS